jgi:hypothetical protein
MDITPVEIIQDTTHCFLCRFESPSSDERVKVFRKSSLDIPDFPDLIFHQIDEW